MRRTVLALAILCAFGWCTFGGARTTLAQATATGKVTGASTAAATGKPSAGLIQRRQEVQSAANGTYDPAVSQAMMMVTQQAPDGQQMVFLVPQQPTGGDVQLVGHHHHQQAAACPTGNCPGGGYAYGSPFAYDRGAMYGYNHPNVPGGGGHYGYWGGAHGTPGYPHHHLHREYVGPQGPPTAQVAYPYYTVRGPRDFLMDNPPSIGR